MKVLNETHAQYKRFPCVSVKMAEICKASNSVTEQANKVAKKKPTKKL